jgi:hypothetical protein
MYSVHAHHPEAEDIHKTTYNLLTIIDQTGVSRHLNSGVFRAGLKLQKTAKMRLSFSYDVLSIPPMGSN